MLPRLTLDALVGAARTFCAQEGLVNHLALWGVTDGKAVGTYVEHHLQDYLQARYQVEVGNSACGIDLPGADIMTDIKVTSEHLPQSSCPFQSVRQKVFGLGYNLLLLVYRKQDRDEGCSLTFVHCAFIEKSRTADYTLTHRLHELLQRGASRDEIIRLLVEGQLPGDYGELARLADDIIANPPDLGVLTVSNALQWRVKYAHALNPSSGVIL